MSSAFSRSSALQLSVDAAARQIAAAAFAVRAAPRILIDGRSGSGKSTLAAAIVAQHSGAQLVALDRMYRGWDGLEQGTRRALEQVVQPHAGGHEARWQEWDWYADVYDEWHAVDAELPLVVEGSGALTAASAALVDVSVWLDADADTRRERALARDGTTYEPHWDRWARQEDEHLAAHRPETLATLRLTLV